MWLRRRGRERDQRKIRVDPPDASFDLEPHWDDGAGGASRRVRVPARDEESDAPGRGGCLLESAGAVLSLHDGRIVLREARGRREAIRLSVPVESCVSVAIEEARTADGSARLRLEFQVEFGPFTADPLSFSLLFPTECRYRLAEFVHHISWSASPLPMSWTRPHGSASGDRSAPAEKSPVDGSPRGGEETTGATARFGRDAPAEPLPEAATSVVEEAAKPGYLPQQGRRSDGNATSSTFERLVVTGVPDTGDWLSFHPLPSSSDACTFRSPVDSGFEGS